MTSWIIDRDYPSRTIARVILGVIAVSPLIGLIVLWSV